MRDPPARLNYAALRDNARTKFKQCHFRSANHLFNFSVLSYNISHRGEVKSLQLLHIEFSPQMLISKWRCLSLRKRMQPFAYYLGHLAENRFSF
jgi:hypothetical protein